MIFKPCHHEFKPFPGLAAGLIPIFPSEVSFNLQYQDNPKQKIYCQQFPICAGYAFTSHKGQGQTPMMAWTLLLYFCSGILSMHHKQNKVLLHLVKSVLFQGAYTKSIKPAIRKLKRSIKNKY